MAMAGHLQLNELLQLGASASPIHAISMKIADMSVAAKLDGLDEGCFPRMKCSTDRQRKICLCRLLQPYCVVGCRPPWPYRWPDMSIPLRFALDSEGPLCLVFRIIVAKTINGTPRLGLVDADAAVVNEKRSANYWPGDFSRGDEGPDLFAIAFSPACGTLTATKQAIQGQSVVDASCVNRDDMREFHAATLNWDEMGDCTRQWNAPIYAALVLGRGKLTFYRMSANGEWHSSGVVSGELPRKVLPCVFLSCFTGYMDIEFIRLTSSPPPVCCDCDSDWHGLSHGWKRVVRQAS